MCSKHTQAHTQNPRWLLTAPYRNDPLESMSLRC